MIVPSAVENDDGGTTPLDFTRLSSQDVGRQHSAWAARLAHGLFVVGQLAAEIGNLKFDLSLAKAHADVSGQEEIGKRMAVLQNDYRLVKAVVEGYETMTKAASREISRRTSERAQTD
jgi:hypothetical protein